MLLARIDSARARERRALRRGPARGGRNVRPVPAQPTARVGRVGPSTWPGRSCSRSSACAARRRGALWLGRPRARTCVLASAVGGQAAADGGAPPLEPGRPRAGSALVRERARRSGGCRRREEPPAILLGLWASDGRALDPDGVRVVQLARHELAVAFRGAQLRETLERERRRADGGRRRGDGRHHPGRRRLPGCAAQSGRRAAARPRGRRRHRPNVQRSAPLRVGRRSRRGAPVPSPRSSVRAADRLPRDGRARRRRRADLRRGWLFAVALTAEVAGRRARATAILRDISAVARARASCAKDSSRRSAMSCERRWRSSGATPRPFSIWSSIPASSATTSNESTR